MRYGHTTVEDRQTVSEEWVAQNNCFVDNSNTSSDTPLLNVLPPGETPIQLFPPVSPANGQIAYELFRSLPGSLEDAVCQGQVEQAELFTQKIQSYHRANQNTGGTIWFKTIRGGQAVYLIYDPASYRLEKVFDLRPLPPFNRGRRV